MELHPPSTTPVIAKHDFPDADDVPGIFIAMGPGIKKNVELVGWVASVFDIAPTILHMYGIEAPRQWHVLHEIFEGDHAAGIETQDSKSVEK